MDTKNGSVSLIWRKYFAGNIRHTDKSINIVTKKKYWWIQYVVQLILLYFVVIFKICDVIH